MNRNVERKAEEALERAGIKAAPVDPRIVAEALGIKVTFKVFEGDLSGALMRPAGADAVIAVQTSHPRNRKRFSIAHEIGHFWLDHSGELFVDRMVVNRRDVRSSHAIDPQEIPTRTLSRRRC